MNRERIHWLAIGTLLTGLASVVSGAIALSLLCLEFTHIHRLSSRPRQVARAPQAVRI